MTGNNSFDFNLEKQRAAERLKELSARSKYKQSGTHSQGNHSNTAPERSGFLSDLKLPFLNGTGIDSDIALILGLTLILTSEKSDKLLLLALLYILI